MPLLLLYRAPSFGCSSFFVHRGLCKNRSIDVRGRTQCYTCTYVNLYGPQLLYSSRKFGQVILTRTVHVYTQTHTHSTQTHTHTHVVSVAVALETAAVEISLLIVTQALLWQAGSTLIWCESSFGLAPGLQAGLC